MAYRPVDGAFWTDPKVRTLPIREKFIFLYLITNPHASFSGLYYLPMPTMLFETGLDEIGCREGIDTLSIGYMVHHDEANSLFWVVNMAKFQATSKPQCDGVRKHLATIQKSPLLRMFAEKYPDIVSPDAYPIDTLSIPYRYPIDTTELKRDTKRETKRDTKTEAPGRRVVSKPEPEEIPENLATDPEWCDLWADWKQARKEARKPITPTSARAQLAKMAEWGARASKQAMRDSIANQWLGLFEPRQVRPDEKPFDAMEKLKEMMKGGKDGQP